MRTLLKLLAKLFNRTACVLDVRAARMGKNKAVKDMLAAHEATDKDLTAALEKIKTLESQLKVIQVLVKSLTKDRDHAEKQLEQYDKLTKIA